MALNSEIAPPPSTTPATHERAQRLVSEYGSLPLSFEPIADRQDSDRRPLSFLARGRGYAMKLSAHEAVLALSGGHSNEVVAPIAREELSPLGRAHQFRLRFVGSRTDARGRGEATLPGKVHYLTGNEPSAWRTNIPTYAKVRYEQVYPGIDLVYYGNQGELEYDFVVAPGADPSVIALAFEGVDAVKVNEAGDLTWLTPAGVVQQHKPFLYQEVDGERHGVEGRYMVDGAHVRVEVGAYDTSRTLVIDPVLVFAGGVGGASAQGVAVDEAGNAYVAGYTHPPSDDGETGIHGLRDAFVRKIDAAGTAVLWTAFIGGSLDDWANAIAIDATGSAYITGATRSTDFPTLNAFDFTYGGPAVTTSYGDAFVAKLTPDGSALVYSTYLGTASDDRGNGIAVRNGNAYVVGETGAGFPTTPGAFQAVKPGTHFKAFVTQLNATGSALVYSTYLGAPADGTPASGGYPDYGRAIALDAAGNAYVTGVTQSNNFPTLNPAQTWSTPTTFIADGRNWAFITKLNPTGSALVYSTYLGGGLGAGGPDDGYNGTQGAAIAVDASGSAYVTGTTRDVNFPKTAGAFDTTCAVPAGTSQGCSEAFVTKLSANGSSFVYSSYLGGTNHGGAGEQGSGIAVDAAGRAHVAGFTVAVDFPVVDAFQPTGSVDAFFTVVNATGTGLEYSTYLGGTDAGDNAEAIALDANHNAYIVGSAVSSNFPHVGGLPSAGSPPGDPHVTRASGFITKFSAVGCSYSVAPSANFSAPASGSTGSINVTTTAGCDWATWTTVPWLTLTPGAGTGSGATTYTVAPNSTTNPRTGTFTVAGTTVIVQQAGGGSNTPPTISDVSNQSIPQGGSTGALPFIVGDAQTSAASLTVTRASSNTTLVPTANVVLGGSGANRTVTITAAPGQTGTTTITLTVSDGALTASDTFVVTVTAAANTPPTISTVADQTITQGTSTGALAITVGDAETGAVALTLSGSSQNQALVPNGNIVFGGSGSARTVTVTPIAGQIGSTTITLVVSDGTLTSSISFGVTVVATPVLRPPVNFALVAMTGNSVTLSWSAPANSLPPTGYVVEGGLTPASVLGSLPTGSTATSFTFTAPTGAFYVRVHTLSGTARSTASNEIRIFVNVPPPPGAPTNLTGTATGSTLALAWRNATTGGAPEFLLLDVTGAVTLTMQLPVSESFSFTGVPPGAYNFAVRAGNRTETSAASNPVSLTFPGGCVAPASPANLSATRSGNQVTVSWSPPLSGAAPSGYLVMVSGAFTGTFPTPGLSLSGTAGPGTYAIAVVATSACGNGAAANTQITVP